MPSSMLKAAGVVDSEGVTDVVETDPDAVAAPLPFESEFTGKGEVRSTPVEKVP